MKDGTVSSYFPSSEMNKETIEDEHFIEYSLNKTIEKYALLFLIIEFIVYVVAWSYITIQRFLSMNAYIYDLGANMESIWLVFNTKVTFSWFLYVFFSRGIIFLFYPVAFTESFKLLLIVQAIFIGGATFPIFGIAKLKTGNNEVPLVISTIYLLFFLSAGANWFDFHFQVLFIFLFLAGYYFYLKKKFLLSVLFFVLSALVRYPYAVFPALFSFSYLLEGVYLKLKQKSLQDIHFNFHFILLLLSISLFIGGLHYATGSAGFAQNLHASGISPQFQDFLMKVVTIIVIFAPFLLVPLLSRRSLFLTLPFLALLFYSDYFAYQFPGVIAFQYSSSITPFLFLGLIIGLQKISYPKGAITRKFRSTLQKIGLSSTRRVVLSIFTIILIMALFFQPYGPLNSVSEPNFLFAKVMSGNHNSYNNATQIIKLIPKDGSNVLVQGSFPELYPRPLESPLLVPGITIFGKVTMTDVYSNSFPVYNGSILTHIGITYVLANSADYMNMFNLYAGENGSMINLLHLISKSGDYGILAEKSGIILLKRGYTGIPVYFTPLKQTILANELIPTNGTALIHNSLVAVNTQNVTIWKGPYIPYYYAGTYETLLSGSYRISIVLKTSDYSAANSISIKCISPYLKENLSLLNITGNMFGGNSWQIFSSSFNISEPIGEVQIIGHINNWNGSLSIASIQLNQISYN